jgi:hypothetical protein
MAGKIRVCLEGRGVTIIFKGFGGEGFVECYYAGRLDSFPFLDIRN